MKMGTTRSLCPYDEAARHALQSANLRRTAILHYDSWAASSRLSEGVWLSFDSGPLDQPSGSTRCAICGHSPVRPYGISARRVLRDVGERGAQKFQPGADFAAFNAQHASEP